MRLLAKRQGSFAKADSAREDSERKGGNRQKWP
jgi:hypothetical protein